MSEPFETVDRDVRERARRDFDTSLFLEAGAGTGKTTLLVDRIEGLVRSGRALLTEIAAVTFTENAATTMKLRLRERLERARAEAGVPPEERARAAAALDVLERAPIATIHALCAAMLQERPIECGVVPGFRVADEGEADVLFAQAWEEWLQGRLTGAGGGLLLEAMEAEIPLEGLTTWGERTSLRGLARRVLEQRDLAPLVAETAADPRSCLDAIAPLALRGLELAQQARAGDALRERLLALGRIAVDAQPLEGDPLRERLLAVEDLQLGRIFGHRGRWPSEEALEEGRGVARAVKAALEAFKVQAAEGLHGRLVGALQEVLALYARKKAERGVLDFLDLLAAARAALVERESVRRHFRERFKHLIIDEFQDTDPIQVEIAFLLAGDRPGDLVVVGDAKQSIYRFRRAEAALFGEVARRARASPGFAVLTLSQNFRSRPAILRFVNRAFGELMQESVELGQPAYEPIAPPPGLREGPAVLALAFDAPYAEGEELLLAEAAALARFLAGIARGAREVRDPESGALRPSRAGDVMVLARRLTQVRLLESALERAGLRFAVEGGKSFFDRQEVHEALAVLRAIEDPTDRVSVVAALRSSFFGVSDRDIVIYHLAGGALEASGADAALPGGAALAPALETLATLHGERTRVSVAGLLERLYDTTRVLAALQGTRSGERRAKNLEKVATLARQAGELGVLTVRGFASLLEERIASAREEPDLPATRPGAPDTLRILSIHKAKGLEAPVVAVFDTADDAKSRPDTVPLWGDRKIAIGFRQGCQPPRWDELKRLEEAKGFAEMRRLLYVACTRARDWLALPQPPGDARVGELWKDVLARLPRQSDEDCEVIDVATLAEPEPQEEAAGLRALASATGVDAVAARWDAERRSLIESAARRRFVPTGATRAAAREAPPPVVPPSGAGRHFGSLVHQILEWIPLDAPEAARGMALALAPRFSLDTEAGLRAASAVERTLSLPVLARARRSPRVWRELPLVFPDGGLLVEGVVDLVFEEEGALVVVDYKTDAIAAEQAVDQAAHHAPQLRLYARGLRQATGLEVRERLVAFTSLGREVKV
ncbi:MAG TPA: UvrD-helicase domain-containing protein [Vicinamibacteria bacterium]|nr:UvrD-helicase domain-containing protein [Vicinamibacteria bacterium]